MDKGWATELTAEERAIVERFLARASKAGVEDETKEIILVLRNIHAELQSLVDAVQHLPQAPRSYYPPRPEPPSVQPDTNQQPANQ